MDLSEETKSYTIDDILERLTRIENKIDRILSISETDGKKMVDHIDFVESVYDQVKSPFTYLMDRISEFTGLNEVENDSENDSE
jgi:fructose-1,6-bisphosphatase